MVLPLVGAALMRAGGSMAGSTAARSAAGSILKTGGAGGGGGPNFKQIATSLQDIAKKVGNILKKLAEHSPMLKQTLEIFKKAWSVTLRPFGDFIGKWLRPMAAWFLKLSVLWYKWLSGVLGTAGGEDLTKTGKQDKIKQLESEKTSAEMRGDTEGVSNIQSQIDALNASMKTVGDSATIIGGQFDEAWKAMTPLAFIAENVWKPLGDAIAGMIPKELQVLWDTIKESVAALGGALQALWDILKPMLEPLWEVVRVIAIIAGATVIFALIGAFKVLEFIFLGIKTVLELLMVGFIWLWEWLKQFGAWIGEEFPKLWEGLKTFFLETIPSWWQTLVDKVKAIWKEITGLWDKAKEGAGKIWDKVKDIAGNVLGGKAVGGPVRETGLYRLHAGERIMTAADTGRAKSGGQGGKSFTNYININAAISSDIDIKSLARKLAEYQEVELRRRISY